MPFYAPTPERQVPTNEHVLSTLALVYKATGGHEALRALYEAACKSDPTNVDHLRGLFLSLVRQQEYAQQQQVGQNCSTANTTVETINKSVQKVKC